VVLGLLISWAVGGQLMAPKTRAIGPLPEGELTKTISLESKSGNTLAGWHMPLESPDAVLILLHGYQESRLTMLPRAKRFREAGYAVVLIDHQAHGESTGEQISIGHLERHDAQAAVVFARATYPQAKIGVLGASMGGAAALFASPLAIDALVIESVYPTIRQAIYNRVAERLGPFAWLPANLLLIQLQPRIGVSPAEMRPIDRVADVACPIFVIAGAKDPATPSNETEALFAAASAPKELWLVPDAGHEDLRKAAGSEYDEQVLKFWETHLRRH
jgi:uncharacterized protein